MNRCYLVISCFVCIVSAIVIVGGCAGYTVKTFVRADEKLSDKIDAVTVQCTTCLDTSTHSFRLSKDKNGALQQIVIKKNLIRSWYREFNKKEDSLLIRFERLYGKPTVVVQTCLGDTLEPETALNIDKRDTLGSFSCGDVREKLPSLAKVKAFKFTRNYSILEGQVVSHANNEDRDTLKIVLKKNQSLGTLRCGCRSEGPQP